MQQDKAHVKTRKWHLYAGWTCVVFLGILTVAVYSLKFLQLDAWQYYFFRGTTGLDEHCTVSAVTSDSPEGQLDRSLHTEAPGRSVRVPHKGGALADVTANAQGAVSLHYQCAVPAASIPRADGVVYLHTGWIFGQRVEVEINGTVRASFTGNDKPVIQITQKDLQTDPLRVDVWVVAPARQRIGISGGQPSAFAAGPTLNNRIMGLDTALGVAKPLYYLLPVIFLGLVCVLGWVQGFRSRLIVAAMFYCILSAIQNVVYVGLDLLPLSFNDGWALGELLVIGPGLGFLAFAMELLGVMERRIKVVMAGIAAVVAGLVSFHLIVQDRGIVYDIILPAYAYLAAVFGTGISIAAIMKRGRVIEDRRRLHSIFAVFLQVFVILPVIEIVLNKFQIWVGLASYVNVFMPLFVGAALFRMLVIIERHLRAEREKRVAMEGELNLAAKLQNLLLPAELKGVVNGYGYDVESKAYGILGGDWVKVHSSSRGAIFILGDVVGKGPTAALTHSGIAAAWAAQLRLWDSGAITGEELLSSINAMMFNLYQGSMNTTFAMAEVLPGGKVRVAAGGNMWLHISEARSRPITSDGRSLLGIKADLTVAFNEVNLKPGEWLVCFTDGVIEGNRAISRFLRAVQPEFATLDAARIRALLHETGKDHVQPDDASSLILRFMDEAASGAA